MLGSVQINKLNLIQGALPDVERHFLFIGDCVTNAGSILTIGPDTDLDAALGVADSVLKTQVLAALQNAGQNFIASVMPIQAPTTWAEAVDFAMESITCEAVVLVDPITVNTDLEAMQTKTDEVMALYMRPIFFMAAARSINTETETWDTYITAIEPLTDNVAADQVCIVPYLWGNDLGALAGRLCDRSVTVADTPMRVATGPLSGEWAARPTDMNDAAITLAQLKQLDANRFSVPQWYPD